jgi:hypothetical protein
MKLKRFDEWLQENDPQLYQEIWGANAIRKGLGAIKKAAMPIAAAGAMALGGTAQAPSPEPNEPIPGYNQTLAQSGAAMRTANTWLGNADKTLAKGDKLSGDFRKVSDDYFKQYEDPNAIPDADDIEEAPPENPTDRPGFYDQNTIDQVNQIVNYNNAKRDHSKRTTLNRIDRTLKR